jgi:hypothetical protein
MLVLKIGAESSNPARSDLCGGPGETPVPNAIALAEIAQDSANQMQMAPLALDEDPSSLPEVDLELVFRGARHPSERDLSRMLKAAYEAVDRVIGTGEPVFDHQTLADPLGGKPDLKPPLDDLAQGSALAGPPRLGPDGRNARFCRIGSYRR